MDRPPFVSTAGAAIFSVAVVILMCLAVRMDALDTHARRVYEAEEIALERTHQLRVIAAQRGCDCACNESKGGE